MAASPASLKRVIPRRQDLAFANGRDCVSATPSNSNITRGVRQRLSLRRPQRQGQSEVHMKGQPAPLPERAAPDIRQRNLY